MTIVTNPTHLAWVRGERMSISALKIAKQNKTQGQRLGRAGLAERVFTLVDEFNENRTYKNAIILAGRLKAISQACKFDSYWDEKCSIGFQHECYDLEEIKSPVCKIEGGSWWIK
jgi:hypothetical protein